MRRLSYQIDCTFATLNLPCPIPTPTANRFSMGIFFPQLPQQIHSDRSPIAFTSAMATHTALIVLAVFAVPAETLQQLVEPMAVRLLETRSEPPKPQPPKPIVKPNFKNKLPPPPQPLLAATATNDAPASFTVPHQPPVPVRAAPIEAAPAPAPIAITAARFDADYLHNPKPVYPHASRRLGEEGKVLLRVYVSPEGLAEKIELKLSSGFSRLDQAAQETVNRWRFVPARRGDEAIAAWVQVPITFQLES